MCLIVKFTGESITATSRISQNSILTPQPPKKQKRKEKKKRIPGWTKKLCIVGSWILGEKSSNTKSWK